MRMRRKARGVSRKSGARSRKSEVRSQEPEAGRRKSGIGSYMLGELVVMWIIYKSLHFQTADCQPPTAHCPLETADLRLTPYSCPTVQLPIGNCRFTPYALRLTPVQLSNWQLPTADLFPGGFVFH